MKPKSALKISLFLFFVLFAFYTVRATEFYQLKVYSYQTSSQENCLDDYLSKAFIPACHRLGIKDVGVFKSITNINDSIKTILVWIPFSNLNQLNELPAQLLKDEEYLEAGEAYINASHNNPPYLRIESTLLKSFAGMPNYAIPRFESRREDRIYELRSYEGPTEKYYRKKVEMFNDAGEIDIFKELPFNPVFFGEVMVGKNMPNLIYLTTHANKEAQKDNWNKFRVHPEWQVLKNLVEYKNTVSHIDKLLLYPTDYSDF